MSRGPKEIISILPDDKQVLALTLTLKDHYRRDLYTLCRNALKYNEVTLQTHTDLIDALEADTKRKLVVLPRGSLKSSIACVGYPIFRLINDPDDRILITSELYTNSKTFLREIKQHMESPTISTVFGAFRGDTWNEGEITIAQRTRIYKEASVTAGGIGTTKVGQHYKTIICDDLNSPDNTNTIENAEKVLNYFRYLISILEPEGTLIVIGTRYSENDVIGYLLKNELKVDDEPVTGVYEVA